jgi:tetratricopeptide (TPR) repeat protein
MNDRLPLRQAITTTLINFLDEVKAKHLPQFHQRLWKLRLHFYPRQAKNPRTSLKLAQALFNSGQPHRAIEICQSLQGFENTELKLELQIERQHILAKAYQSLGQWQTAIESHQTAIALDPTKASLHHALGQCYGQQEQWQMALDTYQTAIALEPKNPYFQYSLGIAYVKTGQWQNAISTLQTAHRSLPGEAWIGYFLGEALLAIGDTEAAIRVYRKTLRRSPGFLYLHICLIYAKHIRQQDQRIDSFCKLATTRSSAKRRMLMIMPYPPYPPTTGGLVRMFHEIKAMGQVYDLTVVSFIFQKRGFWIERSLSQYCQFCATVLMGDCPPSTPNQPRLIHRYSSARMDQVLQKLSQIPFDFVLTDFIQMAQYHDRFPNAFHILGEHNIESELLRRSVQSQSQSKLQQLSSQNAAFKGFLGGLEEADLLADYERSLWPKFSLRMVVSELDREILEKNCTIGKTIVVSNGVDTQNILPLPDNANRIVLFIGTLSYYPNIDGVQYFVQEILPLIWEQDSKVQFWIAGAEPPQMLLDLALDKRIKVIANPEDMTAVARQSCITVVPLRIGSGTRIKILHGMALGLPIVTTSLGCEGIDVTDGQELWVRDRPEDFAMATLDLLKDADRRQQFRQRGRKLVEQHYDWAAIFAEAIDRFETENPEVP